MFGEVCVCVFYGKGGMRVAFWVSYSPQQTLWVREGTVECVA